MPVPSLIWQHPIALGVEIKLVILVKVSSLSIACLRCDLQRG